MFSYENRSNYEWFVTSFFSGTVLAVNTIVAVNDKNKWLKYIVGVMNYRQLPDQKQFVSMFLSEDKVYVVQEQGMKVRRHANCIGAISQETHIRTINETVCIWFEVWNQMSDDFFVKAFQAYLIDKNVSDPLDILCERMLVLLAISNIQKLHQTLANVYFTSNYMKEGVRERLQEKYNFTINDFYVHSGKNGIGSVRAELDMIKENKMPSELENVLLLLLKCNEEILNKIERVNSKELIDDIKNGYLSSLLELQEILNQFNVFSEDNIQRLIEEVEKLEKNDIDYFIGLKVCLLEENVALRKFMGDYA